MSMYVGEALVGDGNEVAHIDLLIGNKTRPVGQAFASALPVADDDACQQSSGNSAQAETAESARTNPVADCESQKDR